MCVISNHVPQEVKDSINIIKSNGIEADIFGMEYKSVIVDEELLKKYDLVVSIGKTVNYCIALGIPIYCYDVFGGPGYINESNYKQALDFHFTGKTFDRKLSAEELAIDIVKNYSNTIKQTKKIRKYAYNDFCFENNMQKVLQIIDSSEDINIQKIFKKYPQLIKKSQTFIYFYKSLASYRHLLKQTQDRLTNKTQKINSIYNSKGYGMLNIFYSLKERLSSQINKKK